MDLPRGAAVVAALCATSLALTPAAHADDSPLGKTTLEMTLQPQGSGGWRQLAAGGGEPYRVRANLAKAKKNRAKKRRSLAFFGQLTDPQLADEMSPARLELIDPASGATSGAFRPQEALGARVFDSIIRNMNANSTSRVQQGNGKTAELQFALLTGDIADSAQKNEVGWFRGILDGATIDPFSGKPIGPDNPCTPFLRGPASQAEVDALNDAVANRRYTGVQDYSDWPGQDKTYPGFWDPNTGGLPNSFKGADYSAFPTYPGLMDRAQQTLDAEGLKVPWYITRGNHDSLVQGNVPANYVLNGLSLGQIATGCQKPWPNDQLDATKIDTSASENVFGQLTSQLTGVLYGLTTLPLVPPDPDRAHITKVRFKKAVGGADKQHGFGYVAKKQNKASKGNATYYAFNRGKFRIIMLDTNAEGGGANGNLDHPQYKWLVRELDRNSSVEIVKGKVRRDRDKDRLIILASHHTMETMDNATPDEAANTGTRCTPKIAGCDSDPRKSTPLHLAKRTKAKDDPDKVVAEKKSLGALLARHPNVVAYVNGHTHHNLIKAYRGKKAGKYRAGFWQINTASHVDWAQQSRVIEVMDNRDGTLSIFGTILDSAAPVTPPAPGTDASTMTDEQLASISRTAALNDPQTYDITDSSPKTGGGPGLKKDRNVEMVLKDPRRLWKKDKR